MSTSEFVTIDRNKIKLFCGYSDEEDPLLGYQICFFDVDGNFHEYYEKRFPIEWINFLYTGPIKFLTDYDAEYSLEGFLMDEEGEWRDSNGCRPPGEGGSFDADDYSSGYWEYFRELISKNKNFNKKNHLFN